MADAGAAQSAVLTALAALHSPETPPAARKEAGDWLVAFRGQNVAWEVSHSLLSGGQQAPESRLFAAQTLRFKVANQLGGLPAAERASLRDSVLGHLQAVATGSSSGGELTVRQLCLVLAELVLQWGGWEAPLADCGSRLLSSTFHEFLQVLAEETQNLAGLGSQTAMTARCRVDSWAPSVMQHLTSVAGAALAGPPATGAPVLGRVMLVLAAWARLGCVAHLPESDMQHLLYAALQAATAAGEGGSGWGSAAEPGAGALLDVLERPPEGIEAFVAPHMVQLPHAAQRAAQAGDAGAASAIIHAYASFCQGNLPSLLSGPYSEALRGGLLQLALLPSRDHLPQPLALTALEAAGCLMEYSVDIGGNGAEKEDPVAFMARQLLSGLLPNLTIPMEDAQDAHSPGTSLRPAAADALAGAARLLGVAACSEELEASRQRQVSNSAGPSGDTATWRWQLAEASLFAHCACAEGTWGSLAPMNRATAGGLCSLARRLGTALSAEAGGGPPSVQRLGSLWLMRWVSAALDPILRVDSSCGPQELATALEFSVFGLQAACAVLRKEEPGEERGAQSSASKLALRCAMGAVDLHKAMQSQSAGGADNSEVLLSGAREMRSLSDAQLMHGDPQMQVVLVGAAVALSQVTAGGVVDLIHAMLQPCEPTLQHATSLLASRRSNSTAASEAGDDPFRVASCAVTRVYAVVRTLVEMESSEPGSGCAADQQELDQGRQAALSRAVALLASCWPMLRGLMAGQATPAGSPSHAKFVDAACRAAAVAMRGDGKAFLPALHGLLQQVHTALQAASQRDVAASETAASLLRCLAAAVEVYGGWNWGSGGWHSMAASAGSDPEMAQALVLSAMAEANAAPIVQQIATAAAAEAVRDLAVAMCAVDTCLARFCVPVLPQEAMTAATGQLLQAALLRAAACSPCNHKNVALAGLSASSALISCGGGPQLAGLMQQVLPACGVSMVSGLLGSLLGAAPLTRLHKATSLLVELVALLGQVTQQADVAASLAKEWLRAALGTMQRGVLLQGEDKELLEEWGPHLHALALMAGSPDKWGGARASDLVASQHGQRLKKAMRSFIQRHSAAT